MGVAELVYFSSSVIDHKALFVVFMISVIGTGLATLCSASITWLMGVDMESSMKLSRSAHKAREGLVQRKQSFAELLGYEEMLRGSADGDFDEYDCSTPQAGTLNFSTLLLNTEDTQDSTGRISRSLCACVLIYDVIGSTCASCGARSRCVATRRCVGSSPPSTACSTCSPAT